VEIESIRHKPLKAFAETGRARGLPGDLVPRIRNMLAYLAAIETVEELLIPPNFGAHALTGDRKGIWSLTLTLTRNWRMTFRVNAANASEDLVLEDYH
jgi:proteic killer suppression protein